MTNKIAVHQMETKHTIDCVEGSRLYGINAFEDERMFLESWFMKCDDNSIKICRDILVAYAGTQALMRLNARVSKYIDEYVHVILDEIII